MKFRLYGNVCLLVALFPTSAGASAPSAETYRHTTNIGWNLNGWNLVSFPFYPDSGQSLSAPLFYLEDGTYKVETVPRPGVGYFYYSQNEASFEVAGSPVAADPRTGTFERELEAGWNLIGNPFDEHLDWGAVFLDGVPLPDSDLVERGPFGYFMQRKDDSPNLGAWGAYWLKISRPASIGFKRNQADGTWEELDAKYATYKASYSERHRHLGGGAVAAVFDSSGASVIGHDEFGDSLGFTGVALAAFSFLGEWDMARGALKYIADCENPAEPGWLFRHPGRLAQPDDSVTSADQYIMVTLGFAAALTNDPPADVRAEIERLVFNIIQRGKETGWVMGSNALVDPPTGASIQSLIYHYERLSELMGVAQTLGETPGAGWDRLMADSRWTWTNSAFEYFGVHLMACRILSAILLDPSKEGLDEAVANFYRAVEDDQNAFADIIYHGWKNDGLDFARVELARFPADLPNTWENNGYTATDYRWQRSPKSIANDLASVPQGRNLEWAGLDFTIAYALLNRWSR